MTEHEGPVSDLASQYYVPVISVRISAGDRIGFLLAVLARKSWDPFHTLFTQKVCNNTEISSLHREFRLSPQFSRASRIFCTYSRANLHSVTVISQVIDRVNLNKGKERKSRVVCSHLYS